MVGVVEVLFRAELIVFVVPSRQIKSLRGRYGSAGNKDGRFDADMLADTLRTDGHPWRALGEDHGDTRGLDSKITLALLRRFATAEKLARLSPNPRRHGCAGKIGSAVLRPRESP
jgi:hypothetical protein